MQGARSIFIYLKIAVPASNVFFFNIAILACNKIAFKKGAIGAGWKYWLCNVTLRILCLFNTHFIDLVFGVHKLLLVSFFLHASCLLTKSGQSLTIS